MFSNRPFLVSSQQRLPIALRDYGLNYFPHLCTFSKAPERDGESDKDPDILISSPGLFLP